MLFLCAIPIQPVRQRVIGLQEKAAWRRFHVARRPHSPRPIPDQPELLYRPAIIKQHPCQNRQQIAFSGKTLQAQGFPGMAPDRGDRHHLSQSAGIVRNCDDLIVKNETAGAIATNHDLSPHLVNPMERQQLRQETKKAACAAFFVSRCPPFHLLHPACTGHPYIYPLSFSCLPCGS